MERQEQRRIAEALILGSPEPVSAQRLAEIVPGVRAAQVKDLVGEINAEYAEQRRAFEVVEAAGGFQLRTLAEFGPYLQQTLATRPLRLSQAALETLAVVAYRQPVTRAEIEHVRGVDVGAVLRTLLERRLVRIAGHRELPGRPLLYATTRRFLEVFGLARIEDLPTLRDLAEFAAPEGFAPPAIAAGAGAVVLAAAAEAPDESSDDESSDDEALTGEPDALGDALEEASDGADPPYAADEPDHADELDEADALDDEDEFPDSSADD
jgi:segregation and condensation protein B